MVKIDEESLKVSVRLLKMVLDKDHFFTLLDDEMIGHLILKGFIIVKSERGDIAGTSLTNKGREFLRKNSYVLESKSKNQMATLKLKQLLSWSDRIGSDEIDEINEIIKLLKE